MPIFQLINPISLRSVIFKTNRVELAVIFKNGKFFSEDQVSVSIDDRGFLFGDGVFTTLKVCEGKVEFWKEHLTRLSEDAQKIGMRCPVIEPDWLTQLVVANQAQRGVFRLKIILTGENHPALDLQSRDSKLHMTLAPYSVDQHPNRLIVYREPIVHPLARIKSLAYLERLWLMTYAHKNKADDLITTDCEGNFLEGAFSNLFWKIGQKLFFPDPALPFLEGVTVKIVKKIAVEKGMKLHAVKAIQIPKEAHCFLCNSLRGISPIASIDQTEYQEDCSFLRDAFETAKHESALSALPES